MGDRREKIIRPSRAVSSIFALKLVSYDRKFLTSQCRELSARETESAAIHGSLEPLVLLPLEVMVKPLEMRFKYHFDGDRPTNKIDKVCLHLDCQQLLR